MIRGRKTLVLNFKVWRATVPVPQPLMVTVTYSSYIIYLAVPGLSCSMWDLIP